MRRMPDAATSPPDVPAVGPRPQVSLVLPCFNEEETIPHLLPVLDKSVAELAEQGRPAEVIIVDDGSSDRSFELLAEGAASRPWLQIVLLKRNYGQTAAMSAGFDRARGDYVVPLDADLQNDPADIPAMLAKLEEGYDVVCGWRKNRKDKLIARKIPSKTANWIIGRVTGVRLHDYGCTLKAFRAEYVKGMQLYGEMHRFLPVYARWQGARITEMVVRHHPRQHGTSKYGIGRTLKVLLDLITVKFLGDYSTKPLYMFGRPGLLCCFLGMIAAGVALFQKYYEGAWVHRNPLILLAVMLFVVGIQLIGMGLIAELQVRTYHESQQKPIYLVRQEVNASCAESPESSSTRQAVTVARPAPVASPGNEKKKSAS